MILSFFLNIPHPDVILNFLINKFIKFKIYKNIFHTCFS